MSGALEKWRLNVLEAVSERLEDETCPKRFEPDFNERIGLHSNDSSSAMYYQQKSKETPDFVGRVTARTRNDGGRGYGDHGYGDRWGWGGSGDRWGGGHGEIDEDASPKFLRMLVLDSFSRTSMAPYCDTHLQM